MRFLDSAAVEGRPAIAMLPLVGVRSPTIIFMMVVLPAPFWPKNPNIGTSTVSEKSWTTSFFLYVFVRLANWTMNDTSYYIYSEDTNATRVLLHTASAL